MRRLEASARQALDRRLASASPRPIAVALSGGGDSLALTLIADAWAREHGRDLLILSVDHRLQAASAAWTRACGALAERLGRPFQALTWEGEKPAAGLPAAARRARHALLADAAREAGARVLLMGHTADDSLEAAAMRRAGATVGDPQAWAPSPAWPEGRGLFLLRPLLGLRRADLRDWLTERGEYWIDDPANLDPRYARSRARLTFPAEASAREDRPPLLIAAQAEERAGVITLPREALQRAEPEDLHRLAALACVCAGGGDRRPAALRIGRLAEALRCPGELVATLAGARIEAGRKVEIFREPGEARRGGLATLPLPPGREVVWDGRFALTAHAAGLEVRRLAGLAARRPKGEAAALRDIPAAARGAMPAIVDGRGGVSLAHREVEVRSLVGDRLRATAGLVEREPSRV